ncbi:MAG: orotidine-5'-phosphate decarboxylase [Hyphomicrobiaceae bacterium]
MALLESKNIPARDRLIVALDVPSSGEAKKLVESFGDSVSFYKLGLELFMAGGYVELIDWLRQRSKQIFVDLKFFDVPQTVAKATAQVRKYGATFATVHGNDSMLRAAVREKGDVKILSVTVLTSLDQSDVDALGFQCDVESLVLSRARRALDLGCDGVISSGLEAPALRKNYGSAFLIVVPGIRPVLNREQWGTDQSRTVDVEQAFANGADYIVVGRPITQAPDARRAAEDVQERIRRMYSL